MSDTLPNESIHAYLERHQQKELLRFLTCGSVDDGKSTLIGRLLHDTKMIYEDQLAAVRHDSVKLGTTGGEIDLALLTDGLKAEREQGITIDVAYRYFSTEKRKFIIADTPGHEQYTRNMATGASTCQLAIILIDARHGVMPQTKRHSFIVSLLGIKHVIVAINKMDLVGYSRETYESIRRDYSAFAEKLEIPEITFIPLSALTGENVVERSKAFAWYEGPTVLEHLEMVPIANDRNLNDFRFPVQYVLRPNLDFRGFAGTVASGVVRAGDAVMVLPSRKTSTIKSIVTWEGELAEAAAPMAVALTLADEVDVSRGDMLVHPDNVPHVARELEAMVVWMTEAPFVSGKSYWIKQCTRLVQGHATQIRYAVDVNTMEHHPAATLALNEVGHIVLKLAAPLAFDAYRKNAATGAFILIDRLTNGTVGAGMIIGPRQDEAEDSYRGPVTQHEKEARLGQRGAVIWASADLAERLERELFSEGHTVVRLGEGTGGNRGEDMVPAGGLLGVARWLMTQGLICVIEAGRQPEEAESKALGERLVVVEGEDLAAATKMLRKAGILGAEASLGGEGI